MIGILRALEANAVFQVEPDILVAKYSFDGYSARNIRKSFASSSVSHST